MEVLFTIVLLVATICFDCDPVPEAPPPIPEFTCFYVLINGEKRMVCE